ncbi:MAG: hypothetical protein PHQ75_02420 [Thermoguttaceae bacterium]|nr:hypothetical protein [Thermoguttaceae bacterium]
MQNRRVFTFVAITTVLFVLCVFSTVVNGEEAVQTEEVTAVSVEAELPYGSELNDPRINELRELANREFTDRTYFQYWRNMVISTWYGDVAEDVTVSYTVSYNRWYPLKGQLIRGYETITKEGRVSLQIDITGCKVYRVDVFSPWFLDYTSLDKATISAILEKKGLGK